MQNPSISQIIKISVLDLQFFSSENNCFLLYYMQMLSAQNFTFKQFFTEFLHSEGNMALESLALQSLKDSFAVVFPEPVEMGT